MRDASDQREQGPTPRPPGRRPGRERPAAPPATSTASSTGIDADPGVAILDRCPNLGRLLEHIVREQRPDLTVRAFSDAAEAERWVAAAPGPVLVIADLEVGERAAEQVAAWRSRGGPVRLVVLADPEEGAACALATTPRPVRLEAWRRCIDEALAASGAWHTAATWRTPPAPGASS